MRPTGPLIARCSFNNLASFTKDPTRSTLSSHLNLPRCVFDLKIRSDAQGNLRRNAKSLAAPPGTSVVPIRLDKDLQPFGIAPLFLSTVMTSLRSRGREVFKGDRYHSILFLSLYTAMIVLFLLQVLHQSIDAKTRFDKRKPFDGAQNGKT